MPSASPPLLRVAIIGGGPGGLGSAIALSALPNVEVTVYEQAKELREIGAGIQIGFNCWKVLELLGAADRVNGHSTTEVIHLNGVTGDVLKTTGSQKPLEKYQPQRVRRTRLQAALKSTVPEGILKLNKRLSSLENLDVGVKIKFDDRSETIADLVIGADGIRSVVREHLFPRTTIFRALIPASSVSHIPGIHGINTWWHGHAGHFYGCPVDDPAEIAEEDRNFEIAARSVIDPAKAIGKRFSWGVPATKERVESFFTDYYPSVRETLSKVPEGQWKEFSAFAGPRLEKLTGWDGKIVLIGDASHPLSGAFGSGAAFALQDGWVLAKAIEHTRLDGGLSAALKIFDSIRSPYYLRMYEHLDEQKQRIQSLKTENPSQSLNDSLKARVASFGGVGLSWIHGSDIEEVWKNYLRNQEA
ncbi:uncharacterized protein RCO7_08687 [Rhynchosporium graminicola]|uniref:FAD-binding domain-containing protein n=1 Tax=Rhynchosporium graminicola TaxID=2792576 RepID=A0A1E1LPC0_9HELO|nr:uncharacterized protein RCO7_08687 [Rhynchosporium commune]